jgi:SAM-dependent methyltransferase
VDFDLLLIRRKAASLRPEADGEKEHPMRSTFRTYLSRFRQEFFPARDAFDREVGTNTSGKIMLRRLRIPSPNKSAGVDYEPVDPMTFKQAIRYVPHRATFVDLGCGKGRALILAHQAGFQKLIGVEFAPALAAVARNNLAALNISAEIVECDAANYVFPDENCVIFMYNPFGRQVLKKIVPRMPGTIVYVNPVHKSEFHGLSIIHEDRAFVVYRSG